mgnify:CR=1 FL=1
MREWLKGLSVADRQAIGTDLLRAQWRCVRGYAVMPSHGERAVGDSNGFANETNGKGSDMPLPGALGGVARVHQEVAYDVG